MPEPVSSNKPAVQGELFFQNLLGRWSQAVSSEAGSVDVDLRLCDQNLRLRFSSRRLQIPFTRAFQHCLTSIPVSRKPDFIIHIFDGADISLPESPWLQSDFQRRSEISHNFGDDILASFLLGPDILNIYHRKLKQAVYWIRNGRQVPFYEQAAPFRHLLHWWLRERDWLLVHGAGIGDQAGRGLLLMGKGGSGKSTIATAALKDSFKFCGDDYCAVKTTPPFRLASIYPTAKLTLETCRMLALVPPAEESFKTGDKQVFFVAETSPEQIPESLLLTALVLPNYQSEVSQSDLRSLTAAQVTMHMAVSSLYQMPHSGASEFARLAGVARNLPGWQLTMPKDNPLAVTPVLRKILTHVE